MENKGLSAEIIKPPTASSYALFFNKKTIFFFCLSLNFLNIMLEIRLKLS